MRAAELIFDLLAPKAKIKGVFNRLYCFCVNH